MLEYGDKSLADFLKRGPLQRNERKFIVDRLAHVVQHMHAQNVVHCDLKPHNFVLFGLKWKVKERARTQRTTSSTHHLTTSPPHHLTTSPPHHSLPLLLPSP